MADVLYNDLPAILTPTVLHLQNNQLTPQPSPPLVVGESVPVLKIKCDTETAVIPARYFGDNRQPQFEQLCDQGDCVCQENDVDESCRGTGFQFKAGVRLKVE